MIRSYSPGVVAMARIRAARLWASGKSLTSKTHSSHGRCAFTSASPKYTGTDPRLSASQSFSVVYPGHSAFSAAK